MLDYESEKLSKEKKEESRAVELIPSPFSHPSLQLVGQIPL